MKARVRALVVLACLHLALPGYALAQNPAGQPGGRARSAPPKLVVVLVIDQMRTAYLERHAPAFTGGLKRLMQDGAFFERTAYPYLNTVTCAGHSTIGTGVFPYRHGMILNAWYDRAAGRSVECTHDDGAREISYAGLTGGGDSAKSLLAPTLADQLREQHKGRVVSLSLKPRSAIGLAGHGGDAVLWFDERGGWATSSAFSPAPVPFVKAFLDANPISNDLGKVWERALDAPAYQHADDREGERAPTGWTRTFPHQIGKAGGTADGAFYTQWARSPFADEYLGRLAAHAVDALSLGRGQGTDFLGVSFSTLDLVGHAFGPESHEVQDVVIRIDRTIGRLLDHLDAKVGRGNYAVAFSSDHGVADVPEQVTGGGRQTSAEIRAAIDGALTPIFGPPPTPPARAGGTASSTPPRASYVVYTAYTDIYLAPGVMDRLKQDGKARTAVMDALRALPGIGEAFASGEIAQSSAREDANPVRRAAALSYHAARSGDIIVVPRENWILSSAATTHGTLHWYDQRVPLVVYGPGVKPGKYTTSATPADAAPTLAAIAGVRMGRTDGRALSEAMAHPVESK